MRPKLGRFHIGGSRAAERVALSSRAVHGFTLIELLIVIIIIGILAAIAIPMFLNQRAKAKDASVKEAVHTVLVGVQSYAVDNNDQTPAFATVTAAGLASQIDSWPTDPFNSGAMPTVNTVTTAVPGMLAYTQVGSNNFTLAGGLKSGDFTGH